MKSKDVIAIVCASVIGVCAFLSTIYEELNKKDLAIGAKAIAEKKMTDKDFVGAKKYILKARFLDPELVGISQMLSTVHVYISSENKVNGERDWYGVLDTNPFNDEETIKKQYRKLARMVHPHKNKSVGANDAFKIVSEAWSLLSDKDKRMAYDQRRYRTPAVHGHDKFWTVCGQCKMHHECSRVDVNRTLLCPNCNKVFRAHEIFRDPLIMSLENLQLTMERSTIADTEDVVLFREILNSIKCYVKHSQRYKLKTSIYKLKMHLKMFLIGEWD